MRFPVVFGLPMEHHENLVGWSGLEPETNGLKGRCSTD